MLEHTPKARRGARHAVRSTKQPVQPGQRSKSEVHEWETARWKHQVEAEARHRPKKELHGESVD